MDKFLAINKEYFGIGLKSIDILIIAQVEEFERNNCKCYMTNEQFSELFGESVSTIKRTLDKLEEMEIIKRDTINNANGSNKSRQRTITLGKKARFKMNFASTKQGSNDEEARFKSDESKVQNEPIKDNLKDNLKENLSKRETANAKEEEVELESLDTEVLKEILGKFEKREKYVELGKTYNLKKSDLNKDLGKKIKEIIHSREHREAQIKAMENCYIPEYSGGADYKPRTKKNKNPLLNDLW